MRRFIPTTNVYLSNTGPPFSVSAGCLATWLLQVIPSGWHKKKQKLVFLKNFLIRRVIMLMLYFSPRLDSNLADLPINKWSNRDTYSSFRDNTRGVKGARVASSHWLPQVVSFPAMFKSSHLGSSSSLPPPWFCGLHLFLREAALQKQRLQARAASYPLTAWRRRSEGKAVRTSTVCRRMRRRAHSTRSSPPLAMKAGIHSTLPLRLFSRCKNRSLHSSLTRSRKARCTTEGFMVTKLVLLPTSLE